MKRQSATPVIAAALLMAACTQQTSTSSKPEIPAPSMERVTGYIYRAKLSVPGIR